MRCEIFDFAPTDPVPFAGNHLLEIDFDFGTIGLEMPLCRGVLEGSEQHHLTNETDLFDAAMCRLEIADAFIERRQEMPRVRDDERFCIELLDRLEHCSDTFLLIEQTIGVPGSINETEREWALRLRRVLGLFREDLERLFGSRPTLLDRSGRGR